MKRLKKDTYIQKMKDNGYRVEQQTDGVYVYDDFGFRCCVSDSQPLGINTYGAVALPKEEFELTLRYLRTPFEKR